MGQATVQRGRLLRGQYAQFTSVGPGYPAWGNSNYHAMQTRFERRFGGGTSLSLSYTGRSPLPTPLTAGRKPLT